MKNNSVEIYIDELVLHGFSPHDRYSISLAIEKELTRIFIEQGVPSSLYKGGNISLLNGGSFNMAKSDPGVSAGSYIAGSVYSAFSGKADKPV